VWGSGVSQTDICHNVTVTVVEDVPASLTARRMQRTREQLIEAAALMFYERGFDNTTVEDVAVAVEVSPRTVYRYFATKDELVIGLSEKNTQEFLAAIRDQPIGVPPVLAVRAAVTASLAVTWRESPWRIRAFMKLIRDTPLLRARWVEGAYDAQRNLAAVLADRAGGDPGDLRNLLAAGAITMAINTALEQWAEQDAEPNPEAYVDDALAHLATPLLAP
jgi:AcrR family transcriptional regulator